MTNPATHRLSNPTTGELGRFARADEIATFRKVGAIDADGQTWYALVESSEIAILVGMYSHTMPRTCAAAKAGDPNAIRSLEIAAFRDEYAEQCLLAIDNMLGNGWALGAIHNRCHALAAGAKTWRARALLNAMARASLAMLPAADRS